MINMKKDSINEAYAVHNNKFSFLACRLHPESNSPEGITVRVPFSVIVIELFIPGRFVE